ncbi:hypothetical protein AVEN_190599-1 [Araneus ventricosus]|uniref:Uncharacterized protein n=1 Tax=Araneus ventricosus TaxID=182803 RepID=A0A4Y2CD55_ARAVE|nr:hypothetical protein AVEN_190599-1 [Araneus ventricosus]
MSVCRKFFSREREATSTGPVRGIHGFNREGEARRGAFSDGPRNFDQRSDNKDDSWAVNPLSKLPRHTNVSLVLPGYSVVARASKRSLLGSVSLPSVLLRGLTPIWVGRGVSASTTRLTHTVRFAQYSRPTHTAGLQWNRVLNLEIASPKSRPYH